MFGEYAVYIWLVVLILCVVIEAASMGLTTIWFALGALVALIVSMFTDVVPFQILAFLVVSLVSLIFVRDLAMAKLNRTRSSTNVDSMIGEKAVVTTEINNILNTGSVNFKGMEWTARNVSVDGVIQTGQIVRIRAIEGVKVIVDEVESQIEDKRV